MAIGSVDFPRLSGLMSLLAVMKAHRFTSFTFAAYAYYWRCQSGSGEAWAEAS
jgi:hypothetical protein